MGSQGLKLTGLTLNNFGPYFGKHDIRFDKPRKGNSVWLFQGLNGAGKTTLFLALIWALYGEEGVEDFTKRTNAEEKSTVDLVSRQAMREGKPYMGVEVYFEHEGKKCILVRRIVPKKAYISDGHDYDKKISLSIDGAQENYPEAKIREILPIDVSQFFFFDGEQVRRYAEPTSGETRQAIEHVLGVPLIKDSADEIKQVATEINRELQRATDQVPSDRDLATLMGSKEEQEKKLKGKEAELKGENTALEELQSRKVGLDSKLAGLEAVKGLQQQKLGLERENELDGHRIEDLKATRDGLKDELPFVLMRRPLDELLAKYKARRDDEDITLKRDKLQVLLNFTEQLLREDYCVCGHKIESSEKVSLKKRANIYSSEIDRINEQLSIKMVPSMQEISDALSFSRAKKADFSGLDSKIAEVELDVHKRELEVKRLEKKVRESDVEEAMKLQKQLDTVNNNMINTKARVSTVQREIEDTKELLGKLDKRLKEAKAVSPTIESLRVQYDLAGRAGDALRKVIDDLIPAKTKIIEEAATETLHSIAHKGIWGDIHVTDKFAIEVKNVKEEVDDTGRSAGENEIVALSFILGLKKAADRDAPVVADFLFGKLDQSHRSNLVEALPTFGDQVIVFKILKGELNDQQLKRLSDLSAGEFLVEFDEKTQTSSIKRLE